jgi:hypothetical protein
MSFPTPPQLTPEQAARQRRRNIAIAVALGALVLIFYAVSMVKVGAPAPMKP